LHAIEQNGAVTQGHDLHDLFQHLSPESRRKIRDEYNRLVPLSQSASECIKASGNPPSDFTLESVLKDCANAFVRWRYAYEGNLTGFFGADFIRDATWLRILELRPDLATLNDTKWPWKKTRQVPLRRTMQIKIDSIFPITNNPKK